MKGRGERTGEKEGENVRRDRRVASRSIRCWLVAMMSEDIAVVCTICRCDVWFHCSPSTFIVFSFAQFPLSWHICRGSFDMPLLDLHRVPFLSSVFCSLFRIFPFLYVLFLFSKNKKQKFLAEHPKTKKRIRTESDRIGEIKAPDKCVKRPWTNMWKLDKHVKVERFEGKEQLISRSTAWNTQKRKSRVIIWNGSWHWWWPSFVFDSIGCLKWFHDFSFCKKWHEK